MGREIRRVAPNWEHPTKDYHSTNRGCWVKRFKPLHDEAYIGAIKAWVDGYVLWERGVHPDQTKDHVRGMTYVDWVGEAPQSENYRPYWAPGQATWFQVYETVSEGTPVSPPCATKEELVEWLVEHGDNWTKDDSVQCNPYTKPWPRAAAEAFVKSEWAPSLVMENGVIKQGYEAL